MTFPISYSNNSPRNKAYLVDVEIRPQESHETETGRKHEQIVSDLVQVLRILCFWEQSRMYNQARMGSTAKIAVALSISNFCSGAYSHISKTSVLSALVLTNFHREQSSSSTLFFQSQSRENVRAVLWLRKFQGCRAGTNVYFKLFHVHDARSNKICPHFQCFFFFPNFFYVLPFSIWLSYFLTN